MNSRSKEAPNNLAGYSGKIKSNQQVFQQQPTTKPDKAYGRHGNSSIASPFKPTKKKTDMPSHHNLGTNPGYQKQSSNKLAAGSQGGHHRRSKTDGNVNTLMFKTDKPTKLNEQESMKVVKDQLQKHEVMQFALSRQQNVNSNINQNKNSNLTAKSAQIQQLSSAGNANLVQNFSMEQAAKNLKMINNSNMADIIQATTRNSNLQNQPRDKLSKNHPGKNATQQPNSNSYKSTFSEKRPPRDEQPRDLDNSQNIATASGQVSIEQLKELMKNPQIASFLKHQLEIQQQQNRSSHQKLGSEQKAMMSSQMNAIQSQSYQICDITQESVLNSDTSQEILKYQKEWAMKFHEQTNQAEYMVHQQNQAIQSQQVAMKNTRGMQLEKKTDIQYNGAAGDAGNDLLDQSSSMMLSQQNRQDDSTQQLNSNGSPMGRSTKVIPDANVPCSITSPHLSGDIDFKNINNKQLYFQYEENQQLMAQQRAEEEKSRNGILNGGKKLSLMTVNSCVQENSAELLFEHFLEDSNGSQKEDEDEYLTFQLCDGEQMNNEMANFIGIHMLNDGYVDGQEPDSKDQDGGLNFQCPKTGSHFEYIDLLDKIKNLKKKRTVIDDAIKQEDDRHKKIKEANKQQKQLMKHKKLKTQVQNILKLQQDENAEEENEQLNDSMPHTGNICTTEDDVLIMEDEDHLQSHRITNMKNMHCRQQSSEMVQKPTGKIYNTHDGRQQKVQDMKNANQKPHNAQYVNQYSNNTNQSFMNGRTVGLGMSQQPNVVVPHQANSLASNHASKISHFSKSTLQQNTSELKNGLNTNPNYSNIHESNTVPSVSNTVPSQSNTVDRIQYHKNRQMDTSSYQQHNRNQSDEINHNVNAQGLMSNGGRYVNIQGNTVVNTNIQRSLVGSIAPNTHNFNSVMGSSIGSHRDKAKNYASQQHKNTSVSGTKNKETSLGHKSADTGTKSSLNRNQGLKQTAQFGPQMNLTKSHLPHQQPGTHESQKNMKGNKVISDRHGGKMNIVTHQGHPNIQVQMAKQQQQTQYLSSSSQVLNNQNPNQRQMIIVGHDQNDHIHMAQQPQTNESTKNLKKKPIVGKSTTSGKLQKQPVKHAGGPQNIYQTSQQKQHQRKTKIMHQGESFINDHNRGNSQGGVSAGSGSHYQASSVMPTMTQGTNPSNPRQNESSNPGSQIVTSIPSSVQSASKKYQNHLNNVMAEMNQQKKKVGGGSSHLQSYSFDFRQHSQNSNGRQNMVTANQQQQQQQVTNIQHQNMQRQHNKIMRSFDINTGGQVQQTTTQVSQTNQAYTKVKSTSLTDAKNEGTQQKRVSSGGPSSTHQMVVNKSLRVGEQPSKINVQSSKKVAEYPTNPTNIYKGMKKEKPSIIPQSQMNNQNRSNYNSAGQRSTKQKLKMRVRDEFESNEPVRERQANSNQNYGNGGQIQNDCYNQVLNQNITNTFEDNADTQPSPFMQSTNPSSKAVYKSKRVLDSNRGMASGTNARVNTFDNRNPQNMHSQQQQQNQKKMNITKLDNRNSMLINQHMNQAQNALGGNMYKPSNNKVIHTATVNQRTNNSIRPTSSQAFNHNTKQSVDKKQNNNYMGIDQMSNHPLPQQQSQSKKNKFIQIIELNF